MTLADLKNKIILISKIVVLPYLMIRFLSTPNPVEGFIAISILIAWIITLDIECKTIY
jgi:hypothetical protein